MNLAAAISLLAFGLVSCKGSPPTSPPDGDPGLTAPPAAKLVIGASVRPDPREIALRVEQWSEPLVVGLSPAVFSRVRVVANPQGSPNLLEITNASPSRSYCPPEPGDRKTLRPGQSFRLEACGSGMATLLVTTTTGVPIDTLVFAVGDFDPGADELSPDWDPAFNIELDYLSDFTQAQKDEIERAGRRWESVITADVEDYGRFGEAPYSAYQDLLDVTLHYDEAVDDLHVFVHYAPEWNTIASSAILYYRATGHNFPVYGIVILGPDALEGDLSLIALHELAHVLGFTKSHWERRGLLFNASKDSPGADAYFYGLEARKAFNQVGGLRYQGRKVPVENSWLAGRGGRDSHWRGSVFGTELMGYARTNAPLSLVTVQAMADLGYTVDASQADSYEVPERAAGKATADPHAWCLIPDIRAMPAH